MAGSTLRGGLANREIRNAVLTDVLTILNNPENTQKLAEARKNAGNDGMKILQFVYPLFVEIQMDVLKKYGLRGGREDTVQFAQLLRALEREDPEVAQSSSVVFSPSSY